MAKVTAQVIVNKAKSYVGTKESPANSNNVIFNTHYYGGPVRGSAYPWCAAFIWDIFRMCGASDLYYGGKKCAYCPTLRNYYKSKGQLYSTPKVGDIVFYQFSGNVPNHVGIVCEVVSKTKIKAVEGNTAIGNDSNGGAVMIRERSTSCIVGYGRPKYAKSSSSSNDTSNKETSTSSSNSSDKYTQKQFIKDVQKALGAKVDGVGGPETLGKTITISATKNNKHKIVKYIQKYLNSIGYDCGKEDGVAGSKFTSAVKKYQKKVVKASSKNQDGIISAKGATWKKLLGI